MIVGEQIILKRLEEEDWQLRYQWISDPEVSSTLNSGLGIPLSATRVKDQVISFLNDTVDADNPAGIRCYEKVGFSRDGVLRDEVFKNGVYVDRIIMSILRNEFKK
jgi:RimJ/RimL family protein N-acetyltransferase